MNINIKQVRASKKIVTNLGNYNSYHVECELVVEVEGGHKPNWGEIWDEVNQQLMSEQANLDASWIKVDDLKDFKKLTVKIPKRKGGEYNGING
jgi:hypothetical protein